MQFTLRDLFGAVTFCAAIAWCAAQVGYDNGLFWAVVVWLSIASVAFALVLRRDKRRDSLFRVPIWLGSGVFGLILFGTWPLIGFHWFVMLTFGIVLTRTSKLSLRSAARISVCAFLVTLGAGMLPGYLEARRLAELREVLPIVSVGPRLGYEKNRTAASSEPSLADIVAERLGTDKSNSSFQIRWRDRLTQLHTQKAAVFARAVGFGVARMAYSRPTSWLQPIELRNIPVGATARDELHESTSYELHFMASPLHARPDPDEVSEVYYVSKRDFLNPLTLGGATEDRLKFAGFIPHAFHFAPLSAFERPLVWTLDRLELVSLLKFDTPRVYVLDHLPRMDQLSADNVRTRPLDKFETAALEQLRTKVDVVVEHTGDQYRMLGSLRAAKQCLDCHSVQRGELLGAFSYALHENAR